MVIRIVGVLISPIYKTVNSVAWYLLSITFKCINVQKFCFHANNDISIIFLYSSALTLAHHHHCCTLITGGLHEFIYQFGLELFPLPN